MRLAPNDATARRNYADQLVMKATAQNTVGDVEGVIAGTQRALPILDELADEHGDKITFVKMNVDENPETAAKYGIQSIPTLMIFKNGEMASRQIGAAPKAKIVQWITGAV